VAENKWITMVTPVSGGRADGRPWPDPRSGEPIEVPAAEADDLIAGGMAAEAEPPGQEPAPAPEADPEPAREKTVFRDDLDKAVEELPDAPAAEKPDPPKPADPKQAWVDYAVACGADENEAAGMTKADLADKYGR
jgi:cell division protein FtsN